MGDITCKICGGDGEFEGAFCTVCMGTGAFPIKGQTAYLKDTFDTIITALPSVEKLIYSYQIVDVIDPTEYAALGEASKDGLRIILSCGVVDLVHTGNIYLNLMAIFGSSPITKAAIEAL